MMDRTRKGLVLELIAYTVLMLFAGSVSYISFLSEKAIQELMAPLMTLMLVPGAGFLIVGRLNLMLGARDVDNVALTFISIMISFSTPFVFVMGALSGPLAVAIISLSMGLPFVSMGLPYLRLGGKGPAILAMIVGAFTGIVMLIAIESEARSLPFHILGIPFIIAMILLDTSCMIAIIKRVSELRGEDQKVTLAPGQTVPNPFTQAHQPQFSPEPARQAHPSMQKGFRPLHTSPMVDNRESVQTFEEFARERRRTVSVVDEEVYITPGDLFIGGKDFYQVLRIPRTANHIEIKRAYRRMALLYHPDRNREDLGPLYEEALREEMRKVNKAKEHLLDEGKRREYDLKLSFLRRQRA